MKDRQALIVFVQLHPYCSGCRKSSIQCVYDSIQSLSPTAADTVDAVHRETENVPFSSISMEQSNTNVAEEETSRSTVNSSTLTNHDDFWASNALLPAHDSEFDAESNGIIYDPHADSIFPSAIDIDIGISMFGTSQDEFNFEQPSLDAETRSEGHLALSPSEDVFRLGSKNRPHIDPRSLSYPLMAKEYLQGDVDPSSLLKGSSEGYHNIRSQVRESHTSKPSEWQRCNHSDLRSRTDHDIDRNGAARLKSGHKVGCPAAQFLC